MTSYLRIAPFVAALVLAALSSALAGCSAVVGASCAEGLIVCEGRCVVPTACGSGFDAPVPLDGGDASDARDGGSLDGGDAPSLDVSMDGNPLDASMDSGPVDSGESDGGDFDADLDGAVLDAPDLDAPGLDAPGLDAPGLDAPGTDAGPPCTPPEVYCAPLCVDLDTDNEHCGRCDNLCASGLCVAGSCVAAFSGHVVLIGHDYETSRIAMRRVVGNAVFLARTSPVRAVVYEGDATAASVAGTDFAIDATAAALGRTWSRTVAPSAAAVPGLLTSADVLLVYAQRDASDATLAMLGTDWGPSLSSFLVRGGVVVVLDTASPGNRGTWQILGAAGLLSATGVTDVSLSTMRVVVPGDAVALGVPLTYRGERSTVRFESSDAVVVISDSTGAPVVIHRTTAP